MLVMKNSCLSVPWLIFFDSFICSYFVSTVLLWLSLVSAMTTIREVTERYLVELEGIHSTMEEEFKAKVQTVQYYRDCDKEMYNTRIAHLFDVIDNLKKEIAEKDSVISKQNKRIDDLEQRPELPPCPLPELTRAALDAVRKWDCDDRVQDQIRRIQANHQKALALKDQEIELLKYGHGVVMTDAWCGMFQAEGTIPMIYWPWHKATRTLHDFLWNLKMDVLKDDHNEHLDRKMLAEEEESEEEDGDDDVMVE